MIVRIHLFAFLVFATIVTGQTPGLIVDPSTAPFPKVLDPDSNGYVSASKTGFVSNDQTESEIVFSPMVFVSTEPTSDLGPGPDCGFTDFVDSGSEDPAMYKSTATYLIFRFRIGSAINNSKGYSVMVDLDQKFGLSGTNADPDATVNNPGFEVEFNLQTNFGVYMYNVGGGCPGAASVSYPGHTNYQKAMALTTNCANPDYFYDFYFRWSDITAAYPGFTDLSTARMVTMTQMNPQPAICNNALSDFGGIDDNTCGGVPANCWGSLINAYTTECPTFTTPAAGATSITGTSPDANSVIRVYRNSTLIGTVTATGTSWTLTGISPAIANNDVLYVTATLSPRIASPASCNTVTVGAACTSALVSSGVSGNSKGICGTAATAVNGAQIFLYDHTMTLIPGPANVFAIADGSFQWKCNTSNANCTSGSGCLSDGAYAVTQKSGSACESQAIWICIGNSVASANAPVITTSPVLNTTTSISGTAISGARIYLYVNGVLKGTATSTGTWTISALALANGDVITVHATETGKCRSTATTVNVQQNTVAPQITGTYCTSTNITSVTGISTEPAGTIIQVYENGVAEGSTTTVSATGTWTATTGINIAVNSVITARATATGKLQSALSNQVTVSLKTTSVPTITTATIVEGATTLTGTGTSGNTVSLYVDGILSTTTTVNGSGVWTFTSLASFVFYTGGVVTVAETASGGCAGNPSASKTVVCANPSASLMVDPASATACVNATVNVTVYLSESGVIYQLYNGASTSGAAQVGTGGTIVLTSGALPAATTLTVTAIRLGTTCSVVLTDNVPVTLNPTPAALTISSNSPVCVGNTINLTANTVTGTYAWTGPNGFTSSSEDPTRASATATMAGTYSATITVSGCTSAVSTTTVVVNSTIPSTPSPSSNSPVCTGNTINLSANTTATSYNWTGPNSFSSSSQNPAISGATAAMGGTYSLTVTSNGCTSAAGTVAVTVNTTPTAPSPTSNSPVCTGNAINLSSNTTATSYSWTGPNSFSSSSQNPSISGATASMGGTYSLTVTSNGCTSAAGTVAVTVNAIPATPSPTSNSPVCTGNAINLSSNTTATSYSWTGPNSFSSSSQNPSISGATASMGGTYSLTVTSNGCTSAAGTVAVTVNTTPTAPLPTSNSPVCTGATINLSSNTTATSYNWTGPNSFSASSQNPAISNATMAMGGTYSLTVTSNGCTSATGTVAVTVNAIPATPSPTSNSPVCTGNAINLSSNTTATSYSWTGPNSFSSSSQNPSISGATASMGGTYSLTVTSNGCTSAAGTVAVTVNATPAALTLGSNSPVCVGNTINLTANTVTGTYIWTGPNSFSSSLEDPSITNSTLAMDGTYSATITVGGCTSPVATTTVVVSPPPSALTLGSNTPVCTGNSINLTANTVTGTYSWTGPNGFTSSSEDPTIANATAAMAGTYSATLTVGTCTSPVATTTVVVNTTPSTPSPSSNTPVCTGNTINLSTAPVAGATYSWTGPNSFSSSSQNPSITNSTTAMAGTYSVTVTANGCTSATGTTAVTVNSTPATPSPGSNSPVCTGNTINLSTTAVAGATYSWTGPSSFSSSVQNPTRASATTAMAGTYSVTVTANGCTSGTGTTAVVINTTPSTPSPSSNTPVCTGNTINLSTAAVAGAIYSWTGPNSFSSSSQNPSITNSTTAMAGTYSVTVTANGCTSATGTTSVTVNTTPAALTLGSNSPVCVGNTINLTANTVTGTYSWTGPNSFSSSLEDPSITNSTLAMDGTYSATITVGGCTSPVATTDVEVSPPPTALTLGSNTPVCTGGDIELTANTIAGTYSWTGPNGFTSSSEDPTITNATAAMAGTYSATVTVGTCTSPVATTTVVVNNTPATPSPSSNTPVCTGNTINLSTAAVAGATYSWTGPSSFSSSVQTPTRASATTAMSGTYSVTVTANGCTSATGTTAVTVNTTPASPTASSNSPVCTSNTINLSTAAVAGATYSWTGPNSFSSSSQNPSITNSTTAMAGTYSVTVTTNGCTSGTGTTAVVINTTPSTPSPSSNTPVCTGNTINLSTAAVAGATYSWTGPNSFTSSSQNPSITNSTTAMAGTYSVTVTANGCTSAIGTTAVTVNTTPSALTLGSNSPVCVGNTINLTANTVTGTYSWTGPNGYTSSSEDPTIGSATLAMDGTYSATITSGGCTSPVATTDVMVSPPPTALTLGSNTPVCTGGDIDLTANTVAGTYSWTGPNGFTSSSEDPTITNATAAMAGTYSATVTVGTCTSPVATTTVVINTTPTTPSPTSNSPVCTGNAINLSANTTATSYNWTGPNSFSSSSQNPAISNSTTAMSGTYSLTVTSNGCTSAAGTVAVTVNTTPATPAAGSNTPVCGGGTINLNATSSTPGVAYSWTGPVSFSSSLQNPSRTSATAAMSGTYTVIATMAGCSSAVATTNVLVNCPPVTYNESYSTAEDTALTVPQVTGILANGDNDPEGFALTVNTTPVRNASHGTITINANGSFVYTPAVNFNGVDTIVVAVSDPTSFVTNDTFFITVTPVNDAPVVDNETHVINEDTPVTGDATDAGDVDPDGTALITATVPVLLPANGSVIVNANGTYTYTPNANFNGTDMFVLEVCDTGIPAPGLCTNDTVSVTVNPGDDFPVIINNAVNTPNGMAVSVNPNSNNSDEEGPMDPTKVTLITSSTTPNGTVSVNPSTGVVTFTPSGTFSGTEVIVVNVCDQTNNCGNDTIRVTVFPLGANTPPNTVSQTYTIDEDDILTVPVGTGILSNGDYDPDGTALTVATSPVLNPANGSVVVFANGSFTYTPAANYYGNDFFVVRIDDSGNGTPAIAFNTDTIYVTVVPINDPPVVDNEVHNVNEDNVVTGDLINTGDSDPDGTALTPDLVLIKAPLNGTILINTDGTYTYTPDLNYNGTEMIVVAICDAGISAPNASACTNDTITINLAAVNDPPVTVKNPVTTPFNTAVSVNPNNNNSDVDGNLQPTSTPVVKSPAHGTIAISASGVVTYVPNAAFQGIDTIVVSICDDGTGIPALTPCTNDTIIVTVNSAISNTRPVTTNETLTTPEDVPLVITFTSIISNDTDPDGTSISVYPSPVAFPSNGSLVVNANGSYTYTPNPNYNGPEMFVVAVCDQGTPAPGVCTNDTIRITVTSVSDNPVIVNNTVNTTTGGVITIDPNDNNTGIEGPMNPGSVTLLTPANPPGGTVSVNPTTGVITFTPTGTPTTIDTIVIVVQVCDQTGLCGNDTVRVFVFPTGINTPPNTKNESYTLPEDNVLTVSAGTGVLSNGDIDPDGTTLTVATTPVVFPVKGSVTINTDGSFVYTPTANANGTDYFVVNVCDAGTPGSACSNDTIFVSITPVNDAPNVVNNTIFAATNTVVYVDPNSNNTDAEGPMDPGSVTLVYGPLHGTTSIDPVTGMITYLPFAGTNGVDTIVVNVCDSGTPLPAQCKNDTIFLRVSAPNINTPPNTVNEYLTVAEDNVLTYTSIFGNDTDVDGTAVSLGSTTPVVPPSNGTVVIQTDGSFVYAPTANFNGTDYFVVSVCDAGTPMPSACTNDTIFISVSPVNDAPTIQNETASTPLNTTLTGSIATNDTDIDGSTLIYHTVPLYGPQYGTFTINPAGSYVYNPTANFTGVDTIVIRVCDLGIPAPGICTNDTLRIFTGNLPPVAVNDTSNTTSGSPLTINVTVNDSDPEGQLNLGSVDLNPSAPGIQTTLVLPGQGTVTVSPTGVVTFTPEAGFVGTVDISYTISDNSGQVSNVAVIHIVVTEGTTNTTVIIPGGITPNGDGNNDYFVIQGATGIVKLQIYNRWGNLVYGNNDYQNDWSGTVNGAQDESEKTKINAWGNNSKLPDGTYFYVIDIADMNFKKAGYIELKR